MARLTERRYRGVRKLPFRIVFPSSFRPAKMSGMEILAAILAVAYAAIGVWLAIRIVNRRERWAKRLAFWLIAAYPISFLVWGFAQHYGLRIGSTARLVEILYRPLIWVGQTIEAAIH